MEAGGPRAWSCWGLWRRAEHSGKVLGSCDSGGFFLNIAEHDFMLSKYVRAFYSNLCNQT